MEQANKEIIIKALDELPEGRLAEVLDFIGYLRWRDQEFEDQSWFWTDEWQQRYLEAKEDLAQGKYKEFENVEDLIRDLKGQDVS